MTKRMKTLLSLAIVSATTASTILPASALSNEYRSKVYYKNCIYLNVNGKRFTLPIGSCLTKPSNPDVNVDESNSNTNNSTENVNNTDTATNNNSNNTNNNSNNTNDKVNSTENSNKLPETTKGNESQLTGNFASYQKEVLDLVNVERTSRGLKPLKLDSNLSNVATTKSQDMINKNYFSHTSPTYGSPFDMMKKFGISYRTAGENIAMGQRNPKEVVTAWMNSEGHRKNILNANFTDLGVGVAKDAKGTIYWTQMFIGK